jgi:transcriptional regulator with XRE-family HTH domain
MVNDKSRRQDIHWLHIRSSRRTNFMPIEPYTLELSIASFGNAMPRAREHTTELGARLTALRKAAGFTQVELAAELGTTQRMIAYYESRAEKAPAALLPKMAAALGVSADELLGIKPVRKGKKPDTQLQRRLQRIEKLDPKARRQITQLLDTFIEREELKQRIDSQETRR